MRYIPCYFHSRQKKNFIRGLGSGRQDGGHLNFDQALSFFMLVLILNRTRKHSQD